MVQCNVGGVHVFGKKSLHRFVCAHRLRTRNNSKSSYDFPLFYTLCQLNRWWWVRSLNGHLFLFLAVHRVKSRVRRRRDAGSGGGCGRVGDDSDSAGLRISLFFSRSLFQTRTACQL